MEPLDDGQQRELQFLLSQQQAERQLTAVRRWTLACALAVAVALIVGLLGLAAGGPGLGLGLGLSALALMVAIQIPRLLWPDRAAEWAVRASVPTEESMRRGDRRNWPPG